MYAVESLIVLAMVMICGYLSGSRLLEIFAMVRSGEKEPLFDQVARRVGTFFAYVFGHKGVLEDKSYGLMHLVYFYGFIILGVGHLELVFFGLTPGIQKIQVDRVAGDRGENRQHLSGLRARASEYPAL